MQCIKRWTYGSKRRIKKIKRKYRYEQERILWVALSEGMKTLRMSASELVIKGVSSISEMYKIVYDTSDFIEETNIEEESDKQESE